MTIGGTDNTQPVNCLSLSCIHHWCYWATCCCIATATRQLAPSDYVLLKASLPPPIAHFGPTIAQFRFRGTQHFVLSLICDNSHGQIQIKIALQCHTTLLHRCTILQPHSHSPPSFPLCHFVTPSVVPSVLTASVAILVCVRTRVNCKRNTDYK